MWLAASSLELADGVLATLATAQLNGKPHQGVSSQNPASHPVLNERNSTAALGLRASVAVDDARQSERARYYGSGLGRFMSPDPSRLSIFFEHPQTWNRYSYVYNDPLSLRDDNGKWPTKVHEDIIEKAFPNLSPEQRKILKNVSASQDGLFNGGQSEGNSYQHAMSSDIESPSDAFNEFSSFISDQEGLAQDAQQQFWLSDPDAAATTVSPEALAAFGKALHAYTDATSPSHEGFQTWRWYDPIGVAYHIWRERQSQATPDRMRQAVAMARAAFFQTFGISIQDAGDGATVTTSQGPGTLCGGDTGNPCPK